MNQNIILFDIDQTIFNRKLLLEDFYKKIFLDFSFNNDQINKIKNLYQQSKQIISYFSPKEFLREIYFTYPFLNKKLDYFFESENLSKYLFEDSKILYEIKSIKIGIFSKGDVSYQKSKIQKFNDVIDKNLIYVFPDKLSELPKIFNGYKNSKLFIVDDEVEVLISAKKINPEIIATQVDREDKTRRNDKIDFIINDLFEIIPILNESR